jgi:3',5'-cyclic-AMP phosphodiesterase
MQTPSISRPISRRQLLWTGAAAVVASPLTLSAQPVAAKPFKLAHLTDLHHQERSNSLKGIEACIEHVLTQSPDAILLGGDLMTGTMAQPLDVAKRFMGEVERVLKNIGNVPMYASVGNHDIWGWNKPRSKANGDEKEYGKKWWADTFGKGQQFSRVDLGTWTLITLDSVQPFEDGYQGGLDDTQFAWLESELKTIPATTPVIVLTHIPIMGAGLVLTDGRIPEQRTREDSVRVPLPSMFADAWRVVELFSRYPNVKLALSGHVHINERVEFAGLTHICGGAVCGSWWRTQEADAQRRRERDPQGPIRPLRSSSGYGIVELSPDSTFNYKYVDFGWKISE